MRPFLATAVLLAVLYQTSAKKFNNPILDNADYPDPGAIFADGVYYVVTTTNSKSPEKFPISTSTDLNNWKSAGYAFTADNFPSWSDKDQDFWAPEIHRIGDNYHLYFSARDAASSRLSIGVAIASSPAGPWRCLDRPLWLDPEGDVWDSNIANDNGNLTLFWASWINGESIKARSLNPDGFSFSSDQITVIFGPDLEWEDGMNEAPWYLRRGDYHYIFYSGHGCESYSVGVARSRNVLGPYEKRGDPILVSNAQFKGTGHNSVVKDTDGVSDVIVFHAWKDNQVCDDNFRLSMLASLGWGADGWPYVHDWD